MGTVMIDAAVSEYLFTDTAVFTVPDLATRYEYKKESGSSDTAHTKDEIKT